MTQPKFSICVFCGSRAGQEPAYAETAREVGQWIGQHHGQLVYGGGHGGLMGAVADATLAAGGRVIGVIPKALVQREMAHADCTELHIVENMHERKQMMAQHADAFLALPGGIGTLEELFEVWTWRQLGYHDKPMGLLNVKHYYDHMLTFLQHAITHNFLSVDTMELVHIHSSASTLLEQLVHSPIASSAINVKAI